MTTGNLILDSLAEQTRNSILQNAKHGRLKARSHLFKAGEAPQHVYFLTTGVASVMVRLADAACSEVAIYGNAAAPGATALLGPAASATECMMLTAGSAYRVSVDVARSIFAERGDFRRAMLAFIQDHICVEEQIAGCTSRHPVEQRLARWLLTCCELAGTDALPLTQQCVAELLSSRRTTVALATASFQRGGLIEKRRGSIVIVDKAGLCERACACYEAWRKIYLHRRALPPLESA